MKIKIIIIINKLRRERVLEMISSPSSNKSQNENNNNNNNMLKTEY